jgi:hypothetical protein
MQAPPPDTGGIGDFRLRVKGGRHEGNVQGSDTPGHVGGNDEKSRVFLMGEDVGAYGGNFKVSAGMLQEFGEERVRDTPVSESAITGLGVGAALWA